MSGQDHHTPSVSIKTERTNYPPRITSKPQATQISNLTKESHIIPHASSEHSPLEAKRQRLFTNPKNNTMLSTRSQNEQSFSLDSANNKNNYGSHDAYAAQEGTSSQIPRSYHVHSGAMHHSQAVPESPNQHLSFVKKGVGVETMITLGGASHDGSSTSFGFSDYSMSSTTSSPEPLIPGSPAVRQLPRSVTSSTIKSGTYSREEVTVASPRSKLSNWKYNIKKWTSKGGKEKTKAPQPADEEKVYKKPSWRRSTANLILAYTGGDIGVKKSNPEYTNVSYPSSYDDFQDCGLRTTSASSPQLSLGHSRAASAVSLYVMSSYRPTLSSTSISYISPSVSCNSTARSPQQDNYDDIHGTKTLIRPIPHSQTRSSSSTPISSSPSLSGWTNEQSSPFRHTCIHSGQDYHEPDTELYFKDSEKERYFDGASSEISADDGDEDDCEEDDEDNTITINTSAALLHRTYSVVKQNKLRAKLKPKTKSPSVDDLNFKELFNPNGEDSQKVQRDGYGCFRIFLGTNMIGNAKVRGNGGLYCFSKVLTKICLVDSINLACCSRKMHSATMKTLFREIHLRPGLLSSKPPCMTFNSDNPPQVLTLYPANSNNGDGNETSKIARQEENHGISAMMKQIAYLERMLHYSVDMDGDMLSNRLSHIANHNGCFISSLILDSRWRGHADWKAITTQIEKLLREGSLNEIESFRWGLEFPIAPGILEYLSSLEGTFKKLHLNGYCEKLAVDGVVKHYRPIPLRNFGGLTKLELFRLRFAGGEGWEADIRYMRDIYGVIIRSPGLRILRLGTGNVGEICLDTLGGQDSGTSTQTHRSDDRELRPWVDIPCFGYDLFQEVYNSTSRAISAENSDTNPGNAVQTTEPADCSLFTGYRVGRFSDWKPTITLKVLSLYGFAIDTRIINCPAFSPGGLEELTLLGCHLLSIDNKPSRHSRTSGFLNREVIEGLMVTRFDEGLLQSVGKTGASKFLKEIFAEVPVVISRKSQFREECGAKLREVYILPSTYRRQKCHGLDVKASVLSSIEVPRRKNENKPIQVLALGADMGGRLDVNDLQRIMGITQGITRLVLGLKELALCIKEDAWSELLRLLPNLENLRAFYLYEAYALRLPLLDSSTTNSTPKFIAKEAKVRSSNVEVQQHFGDPAGQGQIGNAIVQNLKAANIPEEKHHRYIVNAAPPSKSVRKRFAHDDAKDILHAVSKATYDRDTTTRSIAKGKDKVPSSPVMDYPQVVDTSPLREHSPLRSSMRQKLPSVSCFDVMTGLSTPPLKDERAPYHSSLGEEQTQKISRPNKGNIKLRWIGIGRSIWKVVHEQLEETEIMKETIGNFEIRITPPASVQVVDSRRPDNWTLRRVFPDEPRKAGIKIFSMGRVDDATT